MMKIKCEIIQDLLPLYCDNQASQESCKLIKEHFEECPSCKHLYEEMVEPEASDIESVEKNLSEMAPLKKIKKVTRIKTVTAVLVSLIIVFVPFYLLFVHGQQISSEYMELKTSAFIDKDDMGNDCYNVQFDFTHMTGKCIDVRSDYEGAKVVMKPYSQIKLPFDDRGKHPEKSIFEREKDSPFSDDDVVIIQYKDKTVEYNLKEIAEKEGIQ